MQQMFCITGTSRGIGLEFTTQLLEDGHQVIAGARNPESASLKDLKTKFPMTLRTHQLDVTSEESIKNFAKKQQGTTIDVLINNAGVLLDYESKLENLSIDGFQRTFYTNVMGPLLVTKYLLPNLLQSKSPKLVNMTSKMGSIADNQSGHAYAYRLSKSALNMFTKNMSKDYPQLLCLCLHPGWVQTEMGGENALITPEESVQGLLKVIFNAQAIDTGHFYDFKGEEIPW